MVKVVRPEVNMHFFFPLVNCLAIQDAARYVSMHIRGGDKALEVELPNRKLIMDSVQVIEEHVGKPISLFLAGDDQLACEGVVALRPQGSTFRLPVPVPNPTMLSTTAAGCFHPCLVNDVLFDTVMLSQGEIMFGTIGSGMSAMGYSLPKEGGRILYTLGKSIEEIRNELNGTAAVKNLLQTLPKGCSGMCNDPRTSWDTELRGALVFDNADQAKIGIQLLSLHPFLFLFYPQDLQSVTGANKTWPDEISCNMLKRVNPLTFSHEPNIIGHYPYSTKLLN